MLYPEYIQHRKPEINLPYPKQVKSCIFDFYEFSELETDPRIEAKCKQCESKVFMMKGNHVASSYTSLIVSHLRKHPDQWQKYLDLLRDTITPDNKTPRQHFQSRTRCYINTNKDESSKNLQICTRNYELNKKNCAGVFYIQRDIEIFRNQVSYDHQNGEILKYLHKYTNQNVHIFDLIGTKHPGARLDRSYEKSKCIVNNYGDIVTDLERLLCEHVCFFDPEKYEECPNEHRGSISIFSDLEYQQTFKGFKNEIERYPEFQVDKSFDFEILEDTDIIEHNQTALREMNRFLKIVLSMLIVQKSKIKNKVNDLLDSETDESHLRKPNLGFQQWGPKTIIIDHSSEEDRTNCIPESEFSTFQHIDVSECPSYTDNSKKANNKPHFDNGKAYYPCNTGSCLKECICEPCQDPVKYSESNSFKCPQHPIDHPEMYDESEDLAINRRQFVDSGTKQPIFKRPAEDSFLCPPSIKLAQMKKNCKTCRIVFDDHKKHHHITHEACQICCHLNQRTKISFKVTCYLCFKNFKNKYKLADHMRIHDDENPFTCNICDKNFTTKHTYKNHTLNSHTTNKETINCDICGKAFSKLFNLERHKKNKHTENIQSFECKYCESTFKRKDNLTKHEQTNHGKVMNEALLPDVNKNHEPYECYKCTSAFKDKNSLIRHLESVHEDASFECRLCHKMFTRKDNLNVHMKSHANNPPKIICEVCRQEFQTKMELRAHRIDEHGN